MQDSNVIYAKDYQKPAFLIDKTFLRFELAEGYVDVTSHLIMRSNSNTKTQLVLNGENLELLSIKLNDRELMENEYRIDQEHCVIFQAPEMFTLSCVTRIYPEKNTSLEGLYRSRGMYCTQCEAEGFRKITYYLDRPDVMSEFETTLVADKSAFPVMLSNGNCISDTIENEKRVVVWHDPFKKPCYLFALVAGNLKCVEDFFITRSGRNVVLRIFVEEKDVNKCDHAMHSLKNAMRWDEEVYGREYDLDIFMIVAVDDFNMGAMENKGLNIFNTSCVLAHSSTTTDDAFERVEAIVAHEYFHNWSGNRVTCRDWFQLSLKEGFTVYRDAEFSADMNSRSVKRIEDVSFLRSVQFIEDAGPMAHPIRPDSYMEISNFYTVTIYEKGAEIVSMLANILGPENFRKATDLYFQRHDGQAATCEDFVVCMEDASELDLTQFRRWYSQAGTPELSVTDEYNEIEKTYTLHVSQRTPETPMQKEKLPFHIPLKISLFGDAGALPLKLKNGEYRETADNTVMVLDVLTEQQAFVFENVLEQPVPSLLRGFSAPVKLNYHFTDEQLIKLIAIDTDGFSRWDATQTLMTKLLMKMIANESFESELQLLLDVLKQLMNADSVEMAMLVQLLSVPSDNFIAELYSEANPLFIYKARSTLKLRIAQFLRETFIASYHFLTPLALGSSSQSRAARSLRNTSLSYLMLLNDASINDLCWLHFQEAANMTDQFAALKLLVNSETADQYSKLALEIFYESWKHEALVVNMWLQVQAACERADNLTRVKSLLSSEFFDYTNPNKVRSVISVFCGQNPSQFHLESGMGYEFLADQVIYLNKLNPQVASRLLTPLSRWKKVDKVRSAAMKKALERISMNELSKDVMEIVTKSLAV